MVLFMEGVPQAEQDAVHAHYEAFARPLFDDPAGKAEDGWTAMAFFECTQDDGVSSQLRQVMKLGDAQPGKFQLAILDIPDGGGYYVHTGEMGADPVETIRAFKEQYDAKDLERRQL